MKFQVNKSLNQATWLSVFSFRIQELLKRLGSCIRLVKAMLASRMKI